MAAQRYTTTCPTCGRTGQFTANGTQRWPAAVAAAHGLPTTITLWTCPHCHSTLSEIELNDPTRRRPPTRR